MNMWKVSTLAMCAAMAASVATAETVMAKKGMEADMVLLPKFLGILPFDQANQGAQEAHEELGNTGDLLYTGPTPENSVAGQIEIMTTSASQGQAAKRGARIHRTRGAHGRTVRSARKSCEGPRSAR